MRPVEHVLIQTLLDLQQDVETQEVLTVTAYHDPTAQFMLTTLTGIALGLHGVSILEWTYEHQAQRKAAFALGVLTFTLSSANAILVLLAPWSPMLAPWSPTEFLPLLSIREPAFALAVLTFVFSFIGLGASILLIRGKSLDLWHTLLFR